MVRSFHFASGAVVSTLLVACGGQGSTEVFASSAETSTSTAATGGGGQGGGGARSSTAGSGGGGGGGVDNRIDPIALGHSWTYAVDEIGTFPACPAGMHTGAVEGESMIDGKDAFSISSLCTGAG